MNNIPEEDEKGILSLVDKVLEEIKTDENFGLRIVTIPRLETAIKPLIVDLAKKTQNSEEEVNTYVLTRVRRYLEEMMWDNAEHLEGITEEAYVSVY